MCFNVCIPAYNTIVILDETPPVKPSQHNFPPEQIPEDYFMYHGNESVLCYGKNINYEECVQP
jgi:hypothetical protein